MGCEDHPHEERPDVKREAGQKELRRKFIRAKARLDALGGGLTASACLATKRKGATLDKSNPRTS